MSVAVAVGFAFIVGYYGLPFVMSLYLQQLRGLASLATGVAFLPMMLVGALLAQPATFMAGLRTSLLLTAGVAPAAAAASRLLQATGSSHNHLEVAP